MKVVAGAQDSCGCRFMRHNGFPLPGWWVPRPSRLVCAGAFLLFAFALSPTRAPAQSVSNTFWQAQSIYQIITDRFYDGDSTNNHAEGNYNPTDPWSVHGGDFKGLEQKLD